MYKHILIATDGSELAQKGLDQGLQLAKALGSSVTILTVTEPFPMMGTASSAGWIAGPVDIDNYNDNQKAQADEILKAASIQAEKLGITPELKHIDERWPAEAIIGYSDRTNIDLIVMSSHGRRGLGRLLLGSQTSEVLTHTKIAVLVVR